MSVTRPQVLDLSRNKWQWGAPLSKNYLRPAALLVLNGRLTFIDQTRFPYLDIERYYPEEDCWRVYEKTVKLDSNLIKNNAIFLQGALTVKSF